MYTLAVALAVHLIFFTLLALIAFIHFRPEKMPDVMEVTVIVNENLDGNENEPPPLNDPPKPEPPKPQPKPKVEEPPKVEELTQEVVQVIKEKPKPKEKKVEEKKPEEKKPEEKKPEKPKETMEERLKKMRESATESKKPVKIQVEGKSGNGKTQKQTMSEAEIRALLGKGYKPGASNQLATSDLQLGVSLVKMALDDKWASLRPSIGAPGTVILSVKFAASGRMTDIRLVKSCGSPLSDKAALMVARQVGVVHNLPPEFINKFMHESLTIRYNVTAQ